MPDSMMLDTFLARCIALPANGGLGFNENARLAKFELEQIRAHLNASRLRADKETDRLSWLLSLEGRKALHWAVENGEPFTREDIDKKRGQ